MAGALGLSPQDERLRTSFDIAKERGLQYDFYLTELPDAHENSVKMTFTHPDGQYAGRGGRVAGAAGAF